MTGVSARKTRWIHCFKWATVFAVAGLLAACDSKETAIARCHMETLKLWPKSDLSQSHPYDYMVDCMEVAGYHLESISRCSFLAGNGIGAIFGNCYESTLERLWRENTGGAPT
jgi:hypothetical protein